MVKLLVIAAVMAWIGGGMLLTPATYGVGILTAGCLFAILARMAQAGSQHREAMWLLRSGLNVPPPGPNTWICSKCQWENGGRLFECPNCRAARPTSAT